MTKVSIVPFDSIIVGAGPAGITAAVYLARKKLDILVLTLDVGGQANLSTDVENYTGFTFISGQDLVKRFEEHLEAFKIKTVNEKVLAIKKEKDLFRVETKGCVYWAKTVIIATGKKPRSLNVPGEDKLIGRGVTYSALFDTPFFKDKPVVVVGGGNSALQTICELAKFTKKIYVVNITPNLTGDPVLQDNVKKLPFVKIFNNSKVTAIKGDKRVEGIEFMNIVTKKSQNIKVRGVVVEIGLEPSLGFKIPKGLRVNKRDEIDVDQNCYTKVAGLFSAGDVTDVKWKQIIIAAGEGAKAALSAYEYLNKKFLTEKE